jgi:hypothetical protein
MRCSMSLVKRSVDQRSIERNVMRYRIRKDVKILIKE